MLYFIVLCGVIPYSLSVGPFYGVPKEKFDLYTKSTPNWHCLISGESIPYEYINDEFCDCSDGTDEPGTPACSFKNMTFHCENNDFLNKDIPTSFVNDGLCDCCDGSDEYNNGGRKECFDSCSTAKSEFLDELRSDVARRNEGYRIRQEYVQKYIQSAVNDPNKMRELTAKLEQLTHNESIYNDCLAQLNASTNPMLSNKIISCPNDVMSINTFPDSEDDESIEEDELSRGHSLVEGDEWYSEDGQHHVKTKDLKPICETLTTVLEQLEVSSNYDHDMFYDFLVESLPNESYNTELASYVFDDSSMEMSYNEINDKSSEWLKENCDHLESTHDDDISQKVAYAKKMVSQISLEKDVVQREIRNANLAHTLDLGDGSFFELLGNCYSFTASFVFKLCPFVSVTQTDISSPSSVNLGTWMDWVDGAMIYANGDWCEGGPHRSTKVELLCGFETKIKLVEEPEYCFYSIKLITPVVCPPVVFEEEAGKAFNQSYISDEL